jgi:hypothetical protein
LTPSTPGSPYGEKVPDIDQIIPSWMVPVLPLPLVDAEPVSSLLPQLAVASAAATTASTEIERRALVPQMGVMKPVSSSSS